MLRSNVIEVGPLVQQFEEELLIILFGPDATKELKEVSVIHDFIEEPNEVLKTGARILFDDQEYEILQVGGEANKNFEELGHISVYFRDQEEEVLPGAVVVSPAKFPTIKEDTVITVK